MFRTVKRTSTTAKRTSTTVKRTSRSGEHRFLMCSKQKYSAIHQTIVIKEMSLIKYQAHF